MTTPYPGLWRPTGRRALLASAGLLAAAAATVSRPAEAQAAPAFPARPMRWIVGYPPGGGSDTIARLVAAAMSKGLGQPIVVENRGGASANIAGDLVAKAPPDGYTLFNPDNGLLVFNPVLFRRMTYDPERDFRPVGLLARLHLVLVVHPDAPVRSAREFLDRAKAEPGRVEYASSGIGTPLHLTVERLARAAGVRLNHVPYRGAGPAVNDLLAGTVGAMVVDFSSGAQHIRAGTMRPLAVASARRLDALPETPTLAELGFEGFEAYAWQGVVVPAGTPDAVVALLGAELRKVLASPEVAERMHGLGIEPLTGDVGDFAGLLRAEQAVWQPLIRSLGVSLD